MWGSLIGAAFLHVSVYGANQLQVQRYRTVATISQARKYVKILYVLYLFMKHYSSCNFNASSKMCFFTNSLFIKI
jgi:hypothetical protein